MSKSVKLIFSIVLAQSAGIVGSIGVPSSMSWYDSLSKPSFNPPGWIFGPVWFILYLLMGISAYLIWDSGADNKSKKIALSVYLVHLVFNALWSIIFFGWQNPGLAFLTILLLLLLIFITFFLFWRIKKTAALLLIPYAAWVAFATILNYSIWILNK